MQSSRKDRRGHWIRGRRRNDCDAAAFIRALNMEFSLREISRRTGIDTSTLCKYASGRQWASAVCVAKIAHAMLPDNLASLPLYRADMAIDGDTRVGGVGDFTLRAANGALTVAEFDWMD